MQNKQLVLKDIANIASVLTGHGIGEKKVLISQKEYPSPITQIAQTHLKAGQMVESHMHPTMDEHFVFLKGDCNIWTDVDVFHCHTGQYVLIPSGITHQLEVISDTEIITIGVSIE